MSSDMNTCIPAVELAHILDPLDTDDGPLQHLAPGYPEAVAEPARKTGQEPATDVVSTAPDAGYPLAV